MINKDKLGWVLIAWAFFFALASPGSNIETGLMIVGTVIYLWP